MVCDGVVMPAFSLSHSLDGGGVLALAPPSDNLYLRLFAHSSNFALSSGKITTWQGSGSSGKSAEQATAAYQPSPGTGINGKTTVVFGGSQYMTVSNVALGVFDIYIVFKISITPKCVWTHGTDTWSFTGSQLFSGQSASSVINRGAAALSARQSYNADWVPATGTACMVRTGHDGTHAGHVFEKNGATVQQTSAYSAQDPGLAVVSKQFVIGASGIYTSQMTGEIGEILIYDAAPDSARANAVLKYCQSYWGTP